VRALTRVDLSRKRRRVRAAPIAFACLVLVTSCGRDAPPPPRTPTPLDRTTTGTIAGAVRLDGLAPPMTELRMSSFAECASQHRGAILAGDVLVEGGNVQNAFVWLKDGLGDRVFAIPSEPVEIDQTGCLYRPRVAGAHVGQTVRFVNGDPLLHNVHGTPTASPSWNVSLARKGAAREIRIDRPEVPVSVRCDLHPWMQGWIGVVDHPYFAVTGPDGAFALRDVPPGEYTIAVWHERLGSRETRVNLPPSGMVSVTFAMSGK
jgi:plastocyanin